MSDCNFDGKQEHQNLFISQFMGLSPLYKVNNYHSYGNYQTNSDGFAQALAKDEMFLTYVECVQNRLLRRDLLVNNTLSVELNKKGSWINNGGCEPCNFDDIITLNANVILSKQTTTYNYQNKDYTLSNVLEILNDGLYAPNYKNVLNAINTDVSNIKNEIVRIDKEIVNIKKDITDIKNDISNINNKITQMGNGLQKILNNLYNGGAITNNDSNTYEFIGENQLMYGTMNVYLNGKNESPYYIKSKNNAPAIAGGVI